MKKYSYLLIWLVPVVLIVANIALAFTETDPLLAKFTNIILPFGIYLFLMGFWKRTGIAALLSLPFMIYSAFQIVLLFLYGERIIAVDMFLNVATTNFTEARQPCLGHCDSLPPLPSAFGVGRNSRVERHMHRRQSASQSREGRDYICFGRRRRTCGMLYHCTGLCRVAQSFPYKCNIKHV